MPSRGYSNNNNIDVWLHGPSFLPGERDTWPEQREMKDNNDNCSINIVASKLEETNKPVIFHDMKNIFEMERYRNLLELLRVTSYVLRYIHKLKVTARITTDGDSVFCGEIRSTELETARFLWVRNEQKLILINQKHVKDLKYGLYIDSDNILRLKGRLENIGVILRNVIRSFLITRVILRS